MATVSPSPIVTQINVAGGTSPISSVPAASIITQINVGGLIVSVSSASMAVNVPTQVASGPVSFTANNQTIADLVIDSAPGQPMTLAQQQTSTTSSVYGNGFSGCILRNVTLRGRQWGALLVDMVGIQLIDVTVLDVNYCGIGVFGGSNGTITRPVIRRVGMLRTNMTDPAQLNNAYGIKFETASQGGGTSGDPATWTVDHPVIEDVQLWMGINAHQGSNMTVNDGVIRRCPRGMFWAGTISNLNVLRNQILEPVTKSGGTTDQTAISYGDVQTALIDQTKIATAYPNRIVNIDQYLTGPASTNITITNTTIV